jgi:hypothetical protein
MKKKKFKKSELILVVVLVGVIGFVMSLDSKLKKTKKANRSMESGARNSSQAAGLPVDNRIEVRAAVQTGDGIDYWGLDPFDRPFTRKVDVASGIGKAHSRPVHYKLYGIMISSSSAMALIDNRVCSVGDTVQHYTIESINKDLVVIKNVLDGSKRILRVE